MRTLPAVTAFVLMLGVAHADLAPPLSPSGRRPPSPAEAVAVKANTASELIAIAEAGREQLKEIIASVKAPAVEPEGAVTPHAQLPPNPCKSQITAALRLCVQWLRGSMARAEAATLELMSARLVEVRDDLAALDHGMREAIDEQKALKRGITQPPARRIPANPCHGWNISMWLQCETRVDAALAGNLPDDVSAAVIIPARDRLMLTLDTMMGTRKTGERQIRGALGDGARLDRAVAYAIARAEQARRALVKTLPASR